MLRSVRTGCVPAVLLLVTSLLTGCRSGPNRLISRPADVRQPPVAAPNGSVARSTLPEVRRPSPGYTQGRTRRVRVAWRPGTSRSADLLAGGRTYGLEVEVSRWIADERLLLYPPSQPRNWQYIILHHSASAEDSLETIDRYHREVRGWDGCGYHFVIGNGTLSGDGEIQVSERWLQQKHGAHTKVSGHPEYNQQGIGICLVGNFEETRPTELQVRAARALVAYLAWRYDIPASHITTHGRLANGRTACPGRYFPEELILLR